MNEAKNATARPVYKVTYQYLKPAEGGKIYRLRTGIVGVYAKNAEEAEAEARAALAGNNYQGFSVQSVKEIR